MQFQVKDRVIQQYKTVLGVQGDSGVCEVEFALRPEELTFPLDECLAFLVVQLPDKTDGQVALDRKEDEDGQAIFVWKVGNEVTQAPGLLSASLKLSNMDSLLWGTEITTFTVVRSLPLSSPQPIYFSGRPRIADPEQEEPITVAERRMFIPSKLQSIAVQNDKNSETVAILCPRYFDGHDLAQYRFFLRTESEGGFDPVLLEHTAEDSVVRMEWTLRPPQTSFSGRLSIQLWVTGEDFDWQTEPASVTIINQIAGEPVVPVDPPLFEQYIKELERLRQEAAKSEQNAAQSAEEAGQYRDETEQIKGETEAARDEAGQIKNETEQIRDDTQAIRDETGQIKSETEAIRDEAQQIKDSTEITPYIDSSEESGYRAGFQRADMAEPVWTPPLQARVKAGAVTTLPPGANATVTQEGPDNNWTMHLGIPRGEKGEPGRDGVEMSVTTGLFKFFVEDGYLKMLYSDEADPPAFSLVTDPETGNKTLIYTFEEEG